MAARTLALSADNEWSPLRAVIVGRAEHSLFPSEPRHMIRATMPAEHATEFRPMNPFPASIVAKAQWELDNFARVLKSHGVRVYRPAEVRWSDVGGYTGAMPRDGLMTVGSTLIEAPFAWRCRRDEIQLGYSDILNRLSNCSGIGTIYRAPVRTGHDSIYDGLCEPRNGNSLHHNDENGVKGFLKTWAINNSRPAFDAADFLRFGKTIIGQLSHVTNLKGIQYLRAIVPDGYTVEILNTIDQHAMHIDATLLPLREGVLVYNPERVTEKELRRHSIFSRDAWELHPYPFAPHGRESRRSPLYMCSPWLVLNAFSLDERRIFVEENDTQFALWIKCKFGMEPILCPFQHVNSLGGSFHCATVDLVRDV